MQLCAFEFIFELFISYIKIYQSCHSYKYVINDRAITEHWAEWERMCDENKFVKISKSWWEYNNELEKVFKENARSCIRDIKYINIYIIFL